MATAGMLLKLNSQMNREFYASGDAANLLI